MSASAISRAKSARFHDDEQILVGSRGQRADGVPEDGGFDVVVRVDVDAAHELNEFPGLGPVVAAGFVDRFANEV